MKLLFSVGYLGAFIRFLGWNWFRAPITTWVCVFFICKSGDTRSPGTRNRGLLASFKPGESLGLVNSPVDVDQESPATVNNQQAKEWRTIFVALWIIPSPREATCNSIRAIPLLGSFRDVKRIISESFSLLGSGGSPRGG